MSKLPEAFIERMKVQLGEEFGAFIKAIDDPVTTSLRLNHEKISKIKELSDAAFPLSFGEGRGEDKF